MAAWIPVKDGVFCRRHEQTFKRGHMCPLCFHDPPPKDEVNEAAPAPFDVVEAATLPGTLEHEREFLAAAEQCDKIANALSSVILSEAEFYCESGEHEALCSLVNAAMKVRAEATKARRAARESAKDREDWLNTRELEKNAAEIRLGKNRRAASAPPPAPVRH